MKAFCFFGSICFKGPIFCTITIFSNHKDSFFPRYFLIVLMIYTVPISSVSFCKVSMNRSYKHTIVTNTQNVHMQAMCSILI